MNPYARDSRPAGAKSINTRSATGPDLHTTDALAKVAAMSAFHLAHISDLHVLDLGGTSVGAFLNKRLTGLGNLIGPRRGAHPAWLADALAARLERAEVDHVAFTGDLTNLALPSEFAAGRRLLERIGDGARLSAVPGNHDAYTLGAARASAGEAAIAPWATGVRRREDYPWVKAPRPWLRIYGLSSAIAAPAFIAWGEVGDAQRERLARLVEQEPPEVQVRIAMVHHNLHRRGVPARFTAQLRDSEAVAESLRKLRFTALLHGHTHAPHRGHLPGDDGRAGTLVLGCGSSTWYRPSHEQLAHFNVMTLDESGVVAVRSEVWSDSVRDFVPERSDLAEQARSRRVEL
ncbi:MAG: hypothetical protein RIT45_2744 [Pseudomonadota bacterium]|jgi:3',5'-cyclic AMP phosphodiesterase CpdA